MKRRKNVVIALFFLLKAFVLILLLILNNITLAETPAETKTEHYFESIKSDPNKLFTFLYRMPKGGDLHNHATGATFAENMVDYARNDNLCVDRKKYYVFPSQTCAQENLLIHSIKDAGFRHNLIDAWSMRHFRAKNESAHDHFFNTFEKFYNISTEHGGEILSEIVHRAALQNEMYLELMVMPDWNKSGELGKKLGYDADFAKMRERLLAHGMEQIVTEISQNLEKDEAKMRDLLRCELKHAGVGCGVKVRYLYHALREQPPEMVFAQLVAGFESAKKDSRMVGVNLVQPEDGFISMRDYKLHMRMVGFLKSIYEDVPVSLHAGELTSAIVPAEGLKFHIHDAVKIAQADRIGHGVDIAFEENHEQLLKELATKKTLVEINLTSNAQVLNIKDKKHPILLYLQYGVPIGLSTDDEGVSRSSLTNEYQHAVRSYQFSYPMLKRFARNSINFSFLPGKNLWQEEGEYRHVIPECAKDSLGSSTTSTACKLFLDTNEKAKMQWQLENRFNEFEKHF